MNTKKIILFDGVCNLCNRSVHYIIKHDKNDVFRFTSLQSEVGQQLTKERGIDTSVIDSIILIEPGTAYYIRSNAALKIAYQIGGFWKLLKIIEVVLPVHLRDKIYNYIAKNRYKWYGKTKQCMVPNQSMATKFL